MPIEMRRPDAPDTSDWVDALDGRLAAEVRARPRHAPSTRPIPGPVGRVGRSVARIATHGAAAVAAAVVVLTAVGVPSADGPPLAPPTTAVVEDVAVVAAADPPDLLPLDVRVGEPVGAPDIDLLPSDDAAAIELAYDIETADPGLTGVPHSSVRAVPTPEGGGSATVALRPTVR